MIAIWSEISTVRTLSLKSGYTSSLLLLLITILPHTSYLTLPTSHLISLIPLLFLQHVYNVPKVGQIYNKTNSNMYDFSCL